MAAAAFLTRSRGLAVWVMRRPVSVVWRPASAGLVVSVIIVAILSKSALSCARNLGRGRSRSACSICGRVYLGIATPHPLPQRLQRAQLELLDRALGLLQALRDVANAPLVDEPLHDHHPLISGELIHEAEQPRALLDEIQIRI